MAACTMYAGILFINPSVAPFGSEYKSITKLILCFHVATVWFHKKVLNETSPHCTCFLSKCTDRPIFSFYACKPAEIYKIIYASSCCMAYTVM